MRAHLTFRKTAFFLMIGMLATTSACSRSIPRFPLAPPMWVDPDQNHVPQTPGKYFSGLIADGADKSFFRPLSKLFAFDLPGESKNVNAMDEVPNSSWFTNRIGLFPMSPEQAARGPCEQEHLLTPDGPWTVIAAKPDGANPGFFIKAPQGTYLLKFDGPVQPQRATAADIIGTKIYWAAGYFTPCNQILYFDPKILKVSPKATTTNRFGEKEPIRPADVEKVVAGAFRLKNGLLRVSSSRFLPGRPLGPFDYEGTRSDDPNDIIPHEDRRELRGNRILAAWLNHHDAREQNSLDMWASENGRNFIRHYYIDFGDCLGGRWANDLMSKRTGHSYFIDYKHMFVDLVTLGIYPRPWYRAKLNSEAEIFGYYSTQDFVAVDWHTDYQNPAYERMTFRDAMWMVRIISRFTDDHIRQIVKTGKISNKQSERYLLRTLIARRDLILKQYLTKHAPLDRFRLVRRTPGQLDQSLCFEDLATKHGIVDPRNVLYKMRFYGGRDLTDELGWLQFAPDADHPHRSCIKLPLGYKRPAELAGDAAPDDDPLRYGKLTIFIHQKAQIPPTSSIELHFYDLGPTRGYQLVGITRQDRPVPPPAY